jgi:hypothetical protein
MRTRALCIFFMVAVAALGATGWASDKASDKKSDQPVIATCDNPALNPEAPALLAPWPGPDGFGYTGQGCTYSWVDISGTGTAVAGLGDDNYAGPFPVGFTFPFYGASQTAFYVASNGYLSFGAGSSDYFNQCPLPDAYAPDNLIALLWTDLNFSISGTVHYQTFASCPVGAGPCLVVQYTNTAYYGGVAGDAGTWEAILYANGVVRMQYLNPGTDAGLYSTNGIEGANFTAGHGLTYACNTAASLSAGLCIQMGTLPGVTLSPNPLNVAGCPAATQTHTLSLFNNTGDDDPFNMSYAVTLGNATLTGPAQVTATSGSTVPFNVLLRPAWAGGAPQTVTATVTATGNGYSNLLTINKTVYAWNAGGWAAIASEPDTGRMDNVLAAYGGTVWSITGYGGNANVRRYDPVGGTWATIAASAPTFGNNYARSGCTAGSKVYMYGDAATSGFTGLWSYNMATNVWTQETPTGTPPAQTGIWAPAWVSDPATGYCYMTGGATTPGGGNLTTVYVYNPAGNAWLAPLPDFTSVRDFHAAFLFIRPADTHKLLCVAGGNNGTVGLTTTQCYDFTSASWNAEDANLGALAMGNWWAMGYTQKTAGSSRQLWMTGGVLADALSNAAWYYDTATGTWVDGGPMANVAVYRTSATTLNDNVYKVGGSIGSFTYTGLADRNQVCSDLIFKDGFQQ